MPTTPLRCAAACLSLLVAACSGSTVYNSDYRSSYSQSDLGFGADVVTTGARFGLERPAFTERVAAAMPPPIGRSASFQPATGGYGAGNRVVWRFSDSDRGRGDEMCGAQSEDLPAGNPLYAQAAFCRGPSALSWSTGRIAQPVSGPNDPALTNMIAAMTLELFPPRNPRDPSDRGPFRMFD